MNRRRVGVLMGGWGAEREVSLQTGAGVAAALEHRGHDVVRIVWEKGGSGLDELLRTARVDVAFLALHGRGGEDGCVQGLLELMGIPYTGSGVLASALAMDKLKAKEMFRLHNVPTPPYYVATRADVPLLEEMHGSFGFPAIVKPRREGSSIGLAKVASLAELSDAIELALEFDEHALVERFVRATEVHVGLLDGRVLEKTFKGNEQLDSADVTSRNVQYLYSDGGTFYFMDEDSFEQFEIAADIVGDGAGYLKEGDRVQAQLFNGQVISVELPKNVPLEVTYTENVVKGDTTSNVLKDATL